MGDQYKHAKESFVSGVTGSSITHINILCLVALVSVSLYAAVVTRLTRGYSMGLVGSWALLVLPMLLAMTVAAEIPLYLAAGLAIPTAVLLWIPKSEKGTPLPSRAPPSPVASSHGHENTGSGRIQPLPALTTYRAHMMLMTVLCILAVDFPVFPRRLAKCETFGVSLMDLGVGSFVFSQGIVSARPLVRDPRYVNAPLLPKLLSVTKRCLPVIALGVVRVLLVKGTEYPEHVTEYGVHWNFFITLALLPILQVSLHPLFHVLPISAVGVSVAIVQQILLTVFGLRSYALNAPRTSIISANKEGIVSLLGYLSIELLGLSVGTLVLPPSPSYFRRAQSALAAETKVHKRRDSNPSPPVPSSLSSPRQIGKTATELCAHAIMWWTLLGLTRLARVDGGWDTPNGGVSRRIVNVSYILWIAAFNTSLLLAYLVVLDLGIFAAPRASSNKKHKSPPQAGRDGPAGYAGTGNTTADAGLGNPPRLFEVVNKHSLAVFLLANVMTGAVNLGMKTMYVPDLRAMVVLSLYSLVVCWVPWAWEARKGKV